MREEKAKKRELHPVREEGETETVEHLHHPKTYLEREEVFCIPKPVFSTNFFPWLLFLLFYIHTGESMLSSPKLLLQKSWLRPSFFVYFSSHPFSGGKKVESTNETLLENSQKKHSVWKFLKM